LGFSILPYIKTSAPSSVPIAAMHGAASESQLLSSFSSISSFSPGTGTYGPVPARARSRSAAVSSFAALVVSGSMPFPLS
jgi:hypothetical protein